MSRVFKLSLFFFLSCAFAQDNPSFKPFTGKVLGYKVRLRTKPDLESYIISKLSKNDLLLICGEENEFWKVKPSSDIKAYVFRSYVIDNVVEANRVNIRLAPSTDAPVIGQLQKGAKVNGTISDKDHKWLEIETPSQTVFYIAKELVAYAGDESYATKMNRKKEEVKDLLANAYLLTERECKKPFDQMNPDEAISLFEKTIEEYPEFDEFVQQAKEGLALLQDTYLQKKIAFLEERATVIPEEKKQIAAMKITPELLKKDPSSEKMITWKSIEESLFQKWSTFHSNKTLDDFYKEQRINAIKVTGIVRSFSQNVKNKPGDYVLEGKNAPVGYLYSTMVDLDKYKDKEVTLYVSPRSNHHFAFPAYFVIEKSK